MHFIFIFEHSYHFFALYPIESYQDTINSKAASKMLSFFFHYFNISSTVEISLHVHFISSYKIALIRYHVKRTYRLRHRSCRSNSLFFHPPVIEGCCFPWSLHQTSDVGYYSCLGGFERNCYGDTRLNLSTLNFC